ncbi:unnamed protein product [Mytilus coruscus]|uniref:Core-binding (CB) domain-containing protein n=1 Tax=Mytilus coruscus TaxID=42192 RepID=A0A6J8DQB0_MYTCO|nr:unnamed protein product [Mytilus coruscus]
MGSFNDKRRVQIGIYSETVLDGNKENNNFSRKFGYFHGRNKYFAGKRCYRKSTQSSSSRRFLQYIISSSQEKRETKNGNKFKTPQRLFEENTLQNGHNAKSDKLSETERLGNFSRSVRCIFSSPNMSKSQKIHEILCTKSELSAESNVLWSNLCSKSIYKSCISSGSLSKNSKHQTSDLSRQLVNSKSRQESVVTRSTEMSKSDSFTRFHHKQREIKSYSKSGNHLPWWSISFGQGFSISNKGENTKITYVDSGHVSRSINSFGFFENSRQNGVLHRIDSKCLSLHETHSVTSFEFLESNVQGYEYKDPIYTTSKIPSFMVEKFSQHTERLIFSMSKYHCYNHDRCFEKRFWGLYFPEPDFSRGMDSNSKILAHKLFRNESCDFDTETFSESPEKQLGFSQMRQYQCSTVYQSPRGDKVSKSLLFDMGTMAISNPKQHCFEGSPHNGEEKHFGRSVEPSKNSTNRMDFEQHSGESNFCSMGYRKDIKIYEVVPVSDYPNCSPVAKEGLVSRDFRIIGSTSNKITNVRKSVESTQDKDLSSKSSDVKSKCMASLDRNFETEGFSKSARTLLNASWRAGTQKDYSAKFEKYCSWCDTKQIDPYTATLNQVADFLALLFESGLQYRTISGYRSMLSAVLPPVQNCPVGQHPYISRLIKGFSIPDHLKSNYFQNGI